MSFGLLSSEVLLSISLDDSGIVPLLISAIVGARVGEGAIETGPLIALDGSESETTSMVSPSSIRGELGGGSID